MNPLLYWHTLRHLKWVQISGRVRHRVMRPRATAGGVVRYRPPAAVIGVDAWRPSALGAGGRFTFLNESHVFADRCAWNAPGIAKLWLYNLHYFDWINARAQHPALAAAWMLRWVAENPAPRGNGWEPYPLSLRIVNWIKWLSRRHEIRAEEATRLHHSLALQASVLVQRIEKHLLGNHLFENAKALVFAGAAIEARATSRWLAVGARILDDALDEQILPDGGYFELSPMYHAIVLEGLLDLLSLQRANPAIDWRALGLAHDRLATKAAAMLTWLERMTHPDGGIAFFNDAAFGVGAPVAALRRYAVKQDVVCATPIRDGVRYLADSGYVRVVRGRSSAILDVARIGPDYLPGHAHADTLSFEWSIGAQRVIVNSGTSQYGSEPERLRQRGTAAHSTVLVDDLDSSEVWAGFRVARRAYPRDVRIDTSGAIWSVGAAHDGYARGRGNAIHARRWEFTAHGLRVIDRVTGRFGRAEARFHLHPCVHAVADGPACVRLLVAGRLVAIARVQAGRTGIENNSYHPEFGRVFANRSLVVELEAGESDVIFEHSFDEDPVPH